MTRELLWYWFCNIRGIGIVKQRNLLEYFENVEAIFNAKINELSKASRITENDVTNIILSKDIKKLEKSFENMKDLGISFINIEEKEYPEKLKQVYDHPFGIYCKGKIIDNTKKSIAIVGARNCTDYGIYMAKTIGKAVSDAGGQVISGFARGIDTFSHIGALKGQTDTFAVFGCGPDICYPTENIELYEELINHGGIISEYAPGVRPIKGNFPMRNRIISGISDAVIVVEARKKSGSLITVDQALEQGKDVYAVPGRMTDPLSYGCLKLVKSGAGLVTSIEELIEELGLDGGYKPVSEADKNKKNNIPLESHKKMVYSDLDYSETKNIENIIEDVGLKAKEVSAILLELEVMGLVRKVSNNYYIKI